MKTTSTLILCFALPTLALSQGLELPYYTGFDNNAEQAGWEQYQTGDIGSSDWGVGGGGFSVPNCLSHDYNVGGDESETVLDWYVSPAFNFTGPTLLALKVRTSGFSQPFVDNCEVYYSTGSPDPEDGEYELLLNLSFMEPQFTWLDTSVITSFTGNEVYIAIRYKTIGAAWMTYGIDNVNITSFTNIPIDIGPVWDGISVIPNPVHSSFMLTFPNTDADAGITIHDIFGRQLKSVSNLTGNKVTLDRTGLADGIYFARLTSKGKIIETERFVVGN